MATTDNSMPKLLIIAGFVLIIIGLVWWHAPGKLNWFGRLPGDIRIEREHFSFYLPITTMLVLSLVLSLAVRLVRWFLDII